MVLRRAFKLIRVLLALLLLALTMGACTSEYKTYTFFHQSKPQPHYQTAYTTHFSFEYPRDYRRVSTYTRSAPNAPVSVRFAKGGIFSCSGTGTDTTFGFSVKTPTLERRNAKAAVDRTILGLGDSSLVYERGSITVDGLPAELLAYHDPRMPDHLDVRDVFFDFDHRIWHIFIYSDTSGAEQARMDFDHILESFKILQ